MVSSRVTTKELLKGIAAIIRHGRPFKTQLTILALLGVISAIANGFIPYVTGRFFDALIDLSTGVTPVYGPIALWMFFLIIWCVVELVANNIDWIIDRLRRKVEVSLQLTMQAQGFIHLFQLPFSYHKRVAINGELQKLSQASWRVASIFQNIIQIAPQFLSLIIGIVLVASINGMLALVLVAGVSLYSLVLIRILLPVAKIDSDAHRLWNDSWDDAAASVQQVESIKHAGAESYEIAKVQKNFLERTFTAWYTLERTWNNVSFFQRMIVFGTQLTVFIISVYFISIGKLTVGQLVSLNGYALMFFGPFITLGFSWQTIQNGIIAAAHAEDIFEVSPEVYQPEHALTPAALSGDIFFEHVSFQYPAGQSFVLSDINLKIAAGESVAIVGESGVGKSTIVSLISGYNFPTEGTLFIDGIDTRHLDLENLRAHIAVVPQEVALFNDTVRENIRYGSFGASQEEIERVVREVNLDTFIESLPDGYDTLVGERGIRFSVGQKQRVAIARAMLRNPKILVLDEPTSALDAKTEQIVTQSLERLMEGRTTFIIAHRLSTVRTADKILVFEKGKIIERGSHTELLKNKGGVYHKLYDYHIGLH